MNRVPILAYHEVAPSAAPGYTKYTVHPRAFARQMAWVAAAGYTTLSLDELVSRWPARTPRRSVVITFDDGYAGSAEYGAPVLRAREFTATFFLVSGLVGQTTRWLKEERGFELPLFEWATARWLEAHGFACQSHSHSHPRLPQLTQADCLDELSTARHVLEAHLGHTVRHLAYPWGAVDGRVRKLAQQAGYASAVAMHIGRASSGDDVLCLPRIPITGQDTLLDFVCRLQTGLTARELLHACALRLKRAPH